MNPLSRLVILSSMKSGVYLVLKKNQQARQIEAPKTRASCDFGLGDFLTE
jgi:hypothetical protein